MFPRVLLLTLLFNPALSLLLLPGILSIVVVSVFITLFLWYKSKQHDKQRLYSPHKNPLPLKITLVFGGFYALIVLLSHMSLDYFGQSGLLAVAGLSGLSVVDAITLSLAEINQTADYTRLAAQGLFLACASNSLVKLALGLSFSPKATHIWLISGLVPITISIV